MNHFFPAYSHKIFFCLLLLSILFLSACQSTAPHQAYEGSARTNNEVATFNVPDQYNLLSIDGVKYQQALLKDGAIVKLLPDSHQLIIEYQDFWNIDGEEHERVESKPIAITFTAQAGSQYTIKSTQLKTVEQARAFAEKPSISITDTTNKQAVPAKIKYNLYGKGLFTTLFGGPKPESTAYSDNAVKTKTANTDGKALEMLKYWWETADEKQQGDFRLWLKDQ